MNESLRDLLARDADTVERPTIDVEQLVAEAERRLVRRRAGTALAGAAAVAAIAAGMVAIQGDDQAESPSPPPATQSPDPAPELGDAIFFDALAVRGNSLTDPAQSLDGQKDIYVVHEGGAARRILATDADEHCPKVSPDGRRLAWLEGRTVVVRRLDAAGEPTGEAVRVSPDTDQGVTCPAWAPDGQRLAVGVQDYVSPDQVLEVLVVELDGTQRVVGTQRDTFMPVPDIAWSPDGDAIAYTTPDSVWIAPLEGGEQERLWQGRARLQPSAAGFPPYPGMPTNLAWLVTGEIVVGTQTDVDGDEKLFLVDAATGADEVLATFPIQYPLTWSWSPDGTRLVFSDTDGSARVFDRTSGRTEPVTPRLRGTELAIWKLVWSPDGRRLLGTSTDPDPSTALFGLVSMDPDGSGVEVLTPWTMALYSEADTSWAP